MLSVDCIGLFNLSPTLISTWKAFDSGNWSINSKANWVTFSVHSALWFGSGANCIAIFSNSNLYIFYDSSSNFLFNGIYFNLNKSYLKKCERCWNKYELKYSSLTICKKCIFILYYKEFNNINLWVIIK